MVDLSAFQIAGVNHSSPQYSSTNFNSLLTTIESGINARVSVADFLAADRTAFVTDDLSAFEDAIEALGDGGELLVPAGKYYLSATLNVHKLLRIRGEGNGQTLGTGTLIRLGKNSNGVVFNYGSTHGDGLGTQGTAERGVIENLALWGGNVNVDAAGAVTSYNAGDSTTGHGVRIRTPFASIIDVTAAFFGGDGFNIAVSNGGADDITGNGNNFYLERCQAIYNRGNGYLASGSDANAGTFNTCSAIWNGACGFRDYSFLGNSYLQCHTSTNGSDDPTVAGTGSGGGPTGACVLAGVHYYMVAGQETAASTTTPGTDTSVWRTYAGNPYNKTWVSGMTWVLGAPYATDPANVNARNVFIGCYAESAQTPVQATYPSLFIGGLLDEVTVDGSAVWIKAQSGALVGPGFMSWIENATANPSNKFSILGNHNGYYGPDTALTHYDGTRFYRLYSNGAIYQLDRAGAQHSQFTADGFNLASGLGYYNNGVKVLGAQGAAVANATDAASTQARLNDLLARLRTHGIIAT